MKAVTEKRIRYIVSFNRITTFIAKLFFMVSNFKNGEYVCLKLDRSQKFQVVSNVLIEGKIQLVFFNPHKGLMEKALVEPQYLDYSYIEGERLEKLIKNSPDGLTGLMS